MFGSDQQGHLYKAEGVEDSGQKIFISGEGKQYIASATDRESSFAEKPTSLWTFGQAENYKADFQDNGNQIRQTQIYAKGFPVYRSEVDGNSRTGRILDPLTGSVTLLEAQVNEVRETTCNPQWVGQTNPPENFRILKDSIIIDVPPKSQNGGDISYEWPSCVNVQVTIEIPPNINVRDLGAQLTVQMPEVGEATCGPDYQCGPLQWCEKINFF